MPRTLTITFPDRRPEYWFTELVFEAGDRLTRDGQQWIVLLVGEPNGDGKHKTMTVREDGDSPTE